MSAQTPPEVVYLYTNYDVPSARVKFRDLLPEPRVYGSNESEELLTDPSDMRLAEALCKGGCTEAVELLGGARFYYANERDLATK